METPVLHTSAVSSVVVPVESRVDSSSGGGGVRRVAAAARMIAKNEQSKRRCLMSLGNW